MTAYSTSNTSSTSSTARVDLRDPGELLAATPHLLGFRPSDSILVIGHRGRAGDRIGHIVRADLPPPGEETTLAIRLREPFAQGAVGVTVVVVGGLGDTGRAGGTACGATSGTAGPATDPPARVVIEAITDAFAQAGLPVLHALWVDWIRAGAHWRCYEDSCCSGRLPDPSSTVLAAVTTHAGLVTYSSREAMRRQLEPVDTEVLARRSALLHARIAETTAARDSAGAVETGYAAVRAALNRTWHTDPVFSDDDVVELALALTLPQVRDACLATALPTGSAPATTAERLWLTLTRQIPAPERAQPATLLAYSAYVRGEGALAGMALASAREADPDHLLSGLLSQALDHALPPDTLAQLGTTSQADPIWDSPAAPLPREPTEPPDMRQESDRGESATRSRPPDALG